VKWQRIRLPGFRERKRLHDNDFIDHSGCKRKQANYLMIHSHDVTRIGTVRMCTTHNPFHH